jgi:pyruvate decarboxylase
MTAQEISTMLKHDLRPIIFVLENDGYATERWINGWDANYNDVAKWDYAGLPKVFSTKEGQVKTYKVETQDELEELLSDQSFNNAKCFQLVEMKMARDDAPTTLKLLAEQVVIANSKQ